MTYKQKLVILFILLPVALVLWLGEKAMNIRHFCASLLVLLLGACVLLVLLTRPGFTGSTWWYAVVTIGAIMLFAAWNLVDLWRRG